MTVWLTKIQKRIDTNAKLLALYECIKKKVATMLRSFCFWSKSTEEVKQPIDYEKQHWHKYDWEKWVQNNKDEWN